MHEGKQQHNKCMHSSTGDGTTHTYTRLYNTTSIKTSRLHTSTHGHACSHTQHTLRLMDGCKSKQRSRTYFPEWACLSLLWVETPRKWRIDTEIHKQPGFNEGLKMWRYASVELRPCQQNTSWAAFKRVNFSSKAARGSPINDFIYRRFLRTKTQTVAGRHCLQSTYSKRRICKSETNNTIMNKLQFQQKSTNVEQMAGHVTFSGTLQHLLWQYV